MEDIDRLLAAISLRRKGVITREDTLAEGISDATVDNRVRAGILIVMHEGIYRHAAVPVTQDLRDLAAVLACGPDAVLSHRAAARLQGFPTVRRFKPEVTSPHTDLPRVSDFDVHRTNHLLAVERTSVRGIPVTAKGRTALDYCAVTPLWVAQEVIVEAVITKILEPEALLVAIERSGGRGRPGTSDLRTIAGLLPDIEDLESVLELVVARIVDPLPIPRPVRQFELTCADGRRVRLDFAWVDAKVALDPEGKRWHGTPARKRATAARRQSILDTGWVHFAPGWADAHDHPDRLAADLIEAYRTRRDRAA